MLQMISIHPMLSILLLLLVVFPCTLAESNSGSPIWRTKGFPSYYSDQNKFRQSLQNTVYDSGEYKKRIWRGRKDHLQKQAKKRKYINKQQNDDAAGPIRDWFPSITWPTSAPAVTPVPSSMPSDTETFGPTFGPTSGTSAPIESMNHPPKSLTPSSTTTFSEQVTISPDAPWTASSLIPSTLPPTAAPSMSSPPTSVNSMTSWSPSKSPSNQPTMTVSSSIKPSLDAPSSMPSNESSLTSFSPSETPSIRPTMTESDSSSKPSDAPSSIPSNKPSLLSLSPTESPSNRPIMAVSSSSIKPSDTPSTTPSDMPSLIPSSSFPSLVPAVNDDETSYWPTFELGSTEPFSNMPSDAPSSKPSNEASLVPSIVPNTTAAALVHWPLLGFGLILKPKSLPTTTKSEETFLAAMGSFLFSELRSKWTSTTCVGLENKIPFMATSEDDNTTARTANGKIRKRRTSHRSIGSFDTFHHDTLWILEIASGTASFQSKNTTTTATTIPTMVQVHQAQKDALMNLDKKKLQNLLDEWEMDWILQNVTLSWLQGPTNETIVSESSAKDETGSFFVPTVLVSTTAVVGGMLLVLLSIWFWRGNKRHPELGSFPRPRPQDSMVLIHSSSTPSENWMPCNPETATNSLSCSDSTNNNNNAKEEDEIEISFVYHHQEQEQGRVLFDKLDDFVWENSSSASISVGSIGTSSSRSNHHHYHPSDEESTFHDSCKKEDLEIISKEASNEESFYTAPSSPQQQEEEEEIVFPCGQQYQSKDSSEHRTTTTSSSSKTALLSLSKRTNKEERVESSSSSSSLTWESLVQASFLAHASPEKDSIYNNNNNNKNDQHLQ